MSSNFNDETVFIHMEDLHSGKEKEPAVEFLSGPELGRQLLLPEGETLWGRGRDVNVLIEDEMISRHQFRIVVKDKQATIVDLSSKNGTYVNGVRIEEYVLQPGDKIQISPATILRFSYVDFIDTDVHKRIYEMALYDPVTQAHTKRYFLDRLKHEFAHSRRHALPLALIMFDLDHFKRVNDRYGHAAGDLVLQKVAENTRLLIRQEDVFSRFGGEEFVIIMRNCDEANAIKMAERIRQRVERLKVRFHEEEIQITVSLGVSCFAQKNMSAMEELIEAADVYLYHSKSRGRNQVQSNSIAREA